MKFVLDPKLENDSHFICDLALSQVRLSLNAAFPWILLIPKRINVSEIIDLSQTDQEQLLLEIRKTSLMMQQQFKPKKLNIANLGNIVSQLHVHIIARFETDIAWPNPVWNSGISALYTQNELQSLIQRLSNNL